MGCRQFFYVRYIDWMITLPLLTLSLGMLAGQDLVTVAAIAGANMMMVEAGYLGSVALVPTVKWLWFLIALLVFIPVVFAVVRIFRQSAIGEQHLFPLPLNPCMFPRPFPSPNHIPSSAPFSRSSPFASSHALFLRRFCSPLSAFPPFRLADPFTSILSIS